MGKEHDVKTGGYPESDQIMARMRWLTVVLPLCFLLVLLILELRYLSDELSATYAIAVGFSISALAIFVFSRSVFQVLEGLQSALRQQYADLLRRSSQLEALRSAGLQIASHISLPTVLQQIAESSRELVGARYAAVAVVQEGEITEVYSSGLSEEDRAALIELPRGPGLNGRIITGGVPYRTGDVASDNRSSGSLEVQPEMKQFLGVPVRVGDNVIGNIYLADKLNGEFTDEDEGLVSMLALQAAIAIENSRLYEEGRQVAVLKERERIANALHDGAIQSLYGIALRLEGSMELIESDAAQARQELDEAIEGLNTIMRSFRSRIFDIRRGDLESRTLLESLRDLLRDLSVNTLIHTELNLEQTSAGQDPTASLNDEQTNLLYKIAEEALEKVRLHAQAGNVWLDIGHNGRQFYMRVRDDGSGLDRNPEEYSAGGLEKMAGWARALGGELSVSRGPDGGTTVEIAVPLGPVSEGGNDHV